MISAHAKELCDWSNNRLIAEKLFTPGSLVVAFILSVCKDMQSPMNDRQIFVLVSHCDSRFSYPTLATIQASLMNPALSRWL